MNSHNKLATYEGAWRFSGLRTPSLDRNILKHPDKTRLGLGHKFKGDSGVAKNSTYYRGKCTDRTMAHNVQLTAEPQHTSGQECNESCKSYPITLFLKSIPLYSTNSGGRPSNCSQGRLSTGDLPERSYSMKVIIVCVLCLTFGVTLFAATFVDWSDPDSRKAAQSRLDKIAGTQRYLDSINSLSEALHSSSGISLSLSYKSYGGWAHSFSLLRISESSSQKEIAAAERFLSELLEITQSKLDSLIEIN